MDALSNSAQRVQDWLRQNGYNCRVVEMPVTTRTAREAADALGCQLGQIAKSLIFRGKESRAGLLVITSGSNRVNEARLSELAGEAVEKADADFVLSQTGFAIGGVPPAPHSHPMRTWIDVDLNQYAEIWAAAGTPHAVFCLTPADLQAMSGGTPTIVT